MIDFIITDASKEGIVAGALMLYKMPKFDIFVADQDRYAKLLKELSDNPPYTLYISGLPIIDAQFDTIMEAFQKMKPKETKIFYYDNHEWMKNTDKVLKDYFKVLNLDMEKTPAITFYKENWRKKDYEPTKIISLLVDDYVEDREWYEDWDLYIQDILSAKKINYKALENCVRKLSQLKGFSFFEKMKINKLKKNR